MSRSTKNTGSESASEITGNDYHTGIFEGFLERNALVADFVDENRVVMDTKGKVCGDIDLHFKMKKSMELVDLFPTSVACVQHKKSIEVGQHLFFEVTASTGDIITNNRNVERDNTTKLERKVKFYNDLLNRGIVGANDLVVFVYNGVDPVAVKKTFDDLNPMFRGAMIHFPRRAVSSWKVQEQLDKAEAAAEREAALVAEREAALVAEREAAAAALEAALVAERAAAAALEAALVAEREAAAAEREAAAEKIRKLETMLQEAVARAGI